MYRRSAHLDERSSFENDFGTVVSLDTFLTRRRTYRDGSGIDDRDLYVDPLAPFALPTAAAIPGSRTTASADCPRAWLPSALFDLRHPSAPRVPTTRTRLVAAATTAAFIGTGLWRPGHGFAAIGARYGIRFDCPDVRLRYAAWRAGGFDGELDHVEHDVHQLVLVSARAASAEHLMPLVRARQHRIAAMLLEETAHVASAPDARQALTAILTVGTDTLGDLPSAGPRRIADDLLAAAAIIQAAPGQPAPPLTDHLRAAAVARISAAIAPHAH